MRYAVRALLKTPAYTLVALLTLALGIGANTAIFSVVNQVLLNPAGVSRPGRVVALRVKYDKLALRNIGVSVPDFADVLHSAQQFESAALISTGDFNYTGSGVPERLNGASVTYRWFDVFGARPALGRAFQAEDDRPNANREVVLSNAAWKRLFGEDPHVVDRSIELNQTAYRIVGVMSANFRWPVNIDLWVPLGLADNAYSPGNRFNENYGGVARLRPGVPFASANAFVGVLSNRVKSGSDRAAGYAKDAAWGMFLLPFTDFIAGDTRTPMLVLLGAVGFVLMIACANIAGLMLARASGRTREIAVRAALGAGRWDLIRQSFCESMALAGGGAVAGLGVALGGIRGLLALAPQGLPVAVSVRLDAPVLIFAVLAAAVAGLLFGVAPAWQISRLNRFELLKEGGRANSSGRARQQLRSSLVVAEVALALVLLVGAGLFLRSLAALEDVNPGFQTAGVITGGLSLPPARYDTAVKQLAFYQAVLDNLAATPGVAAVAAGMPLPFSGNGGSASFQIDGRPSPPGDPGPHGDIGAVSADYFTALKIPIRQGRVFTSLDRQDTQPVALIDEILARQYWPGQNPVGQHIRRGNSAPWATIVGVVGHVKQSDLAGEDVEGEVLFPRCSKCTRAVHELRDACAIRPGPPLHGDARCGTRGGPHAAALADSPDDRYGEQLAGAARRSYVVTGAGRLRDDGTGDGLDRTVRSDQLRGDAAHAGIGRADGFGRAAGGDFADGIGAGNETRRRGRGGRAGGVAGDESIPAGRALPCERRRPVDVCDYGGGADRRCVARELHPGAARYAGGPHGGAAV